MSALIGLAVAAGIWWALKEFGRTDPARLRRAVRNLPKLAGGVVALGLAALLLLRGQIEMALLAGGVGAWLMGWSAELPARLRGLFGGGDAVARRSATIDKGTAGQPATILAGPFRGRALDSLGPDELGAVRSFCLQNDPEGLALVEAYLDRRAPGWREHAHLYGDARGRADPERRPMSEQEAYEVLGLQPGCGPDAVRSAHRSLMKKLHPDQGGSTYLASRVNEAKDVLLNRHR